jgi:4-alpha-glucanotransferase
VTASSATRGLQKLARHHGLQTAYYNMGHRRHSASAESLLAALRILGAPVAGIRDVAPALREERQRRWHQAIQPVIVAWEGTPPRVLVRMPAQEHGTTLSAHLHLESGETRRLEWRLGDLPVEQRADVEGEPCEARWLPLPSDLPLGYHRLTLELPGGSTEALIMSAPRTAYVPAGTPSGGARFWGVFLPLYALHTGRSWGGGDLTDLEALIEWTGGNGGEVVATLPLLPVFLDDSFDPSPYSPVSRLAWNEFYVDVERSPHLNRCPAAQDLITSSSFQRTLARLRKAPLVAYREQMGLKRRVLEHLARCCCEEGAVGERLLQDFRLRNPTLEEYARFRAARERVGASWRSWPPRLRDVRLGPGDYDSEVQRYYLYAQWLLHQEIESLGDKARRANVGLYLDYPLGVHPDGFDVWRHKHLFMLDASAGAPPDPVFTSGQDWGFPPLHPEALRRDGYWYYRSCLRHHMACARILRIDHVMGFHRMFVIPEGMGPRDGVYVRYHPEEFYAVLAIESQRARTLVAGEDLGTVPPYVRPAMRRRGVHRTYVVQYELGANGCDFVPAVPRHSVASVNTHDMPPLEAFWRGLDIGDRVRAGLTDARSAKREEKDRKAQKAFFTSFLEGRGQPGWGDHSGSTSVLDGALEFLSASPATAVIVNVEDLWEETESQNLPGTGPEHTNWRRKARYALEEFSQKEPVVAALRRVDRARRRGRGHARKGL